MKLKIGYSATLWDDCRSGIGTYIAQQLKELYRRPRIDLRIFEYGGEILIPPNLPSQSGTSSGTKSKLRPLRDILWHRHSLASVVNREHLHLVHIPSIRRLPAKLSCPSVITVHDLAPLRLKGKYGFLRDIYHKQVVPRWLANVQAIVTPSQSTKRDLLNIYGVPDEKVSVIPNGVNHSLYRTGNIGESRGIIEAKYGLKAPYFVYVSRLEHPSKNHVRLLEAFERFKAKGHPHRLALVGSKWNGSEIIEEKLMSLKGVADHFGHVPSEDLPHFLRASTALVYPSLFEGFGLPVVEAMACGTPVACSKGSSLEEVADGHALLFDPHVPEEIAHRLSELATNPQLCRQLTSEGLVHAQRFTWENCVSETIRVWERVLQP